MTDDATIKPHHLVIEGPIGVGKTELATRLARTLGYRTVLEDGAANPFLPSFYRADRRRVALATQLSFLVQRTQQLQVLLQGDIFAQAHVADYLIEKDRLFAELNLNTDEFKLYEALYARLSADLPNPDLVVYLQAPTALLMQRIHHRGIPYERRIQRDYIERLSEAYSRFFFHYHAAPLLIINTAEVNLLHNADDYRDFLSLLNRVDSGHHYFNAGGSGTLFPESTFP